MTGIGDEPSVARGPQDPAQPIRQAQRIGGVRAWLTATDLAIYKAVRSLATDPEMVRRVKAFSTLGEYAGIWVAIGLTGAAVDPWRRRRWLRAVAGIGLAHGVSSTVKVMIGRRRPAVEDLPHLMATPTGLSFPSSHSASSFAGARALSALLPPVPLYTAATAMALSRLYLGVHYPSDVAAGATVGVIVGSVGR